MPDQALHWYAVKGLFRWFASDTGETTSVEERVVLFHAESFAQALVFAEQEAAAYCQVPTPTHPLRIEPMGWWNAYFLDAPELHSGSEVYSRLMDTTLPTTAFLRRYYPKSHDQRVAEATPEASLHDISPSGSLGWEEEARVVEHTDGWELWE